MIISNISINHRNQKTLKAYVRITFDNSFTVNDIKITRNAKGLHVSMPRKGNKDVAYFINKDVGSLIEEAILNQYHEETKYEFKMESGQSDS